MGLGSSHGVCGCLPMASGEFDFSAAQEACSSYAIPPLPSTFERLSKTTTQAGILSEIGLDAHRKPCEKGGKHRELIVAALRANRLFASLGQAGLEDLVDSFDYYSFDQNEFVVKEGEMGSHVFVSDSLGLEVMLNGGCVAKMPRGRTFGELALLNHYPRSVSVMANHPQVGVWGMHAQSFREALLKVMVGRLKDNRSFLDTIPLFKALSARQRDDVCDAARLRIVEADESLHLRDSEAGQTHQQVYLVKSGVLLVAAQAGEFLRSGDVVGERTLLYGEKFHVEAVATKKSELLVVNLMHLREILGDALHPVHLLKDDCLQSLMSNSSFASLDSSQQAVAMKNLEFQEFQPSTETRPPPLFVVVDGCATVGEVRLTKGMSFGEFPEVCSENGEAALPSPTKAPKPPSSPSSLVAGPHGVRLAAMTVRKVSMTLEEFGLDLDEVGWEDEEHRKERTMSEISKVCVFRHLPAYQIETLAGGTYRQRYQKGEIIIQEGDEDCKYFYILMNGEVSINVGGEAIRSLTKYAYFGERAILFNEPRAASIEVASEQAEIWAIGVDAFKEVVQEKSQTEEQLLNRMQLQDHDIALRDLEPRDVLGSGTFGVVTLVQHRNTHFLYALKQVKKSNVEAMKDVRREVWVLKENDHPFIMHLVKTFETQKSFYMLTEYCAGGELHAAIRTIDVALNRWQTMFYVGSLVLMLEALAERCIVYRDLKPENLMLDSKGYLKLIDFGTAKKLDPSCPRTTTRIGTLHYTAPEVFGENGYGIEVDIWSLGVILFELMCGQLPFGNELEDSPDMSDITLDEVKKGEYTIPPVVDISGQELIKKLLVLHPASRLGSGKDGFLELKRHRFFRLEDLDFGEICEAPSTDCSKHKDYFSMLLSRVLKAPLAAPVRPVPETFEACSGYWPPSPTKSPKKKGSKERSNTDNLENSVDTSGSASPMAYLSQCTFPSEVNSESPVTVKLGSVHGATCLKSRGQAALEKPKASSFERCD